MISQGSCRPSACATTSPTQRHKGLGFRGRGVEGLSVEGSGVQVLGADRQRV